MAEPIVVVTGSALSPLGTLPFQSAEALPPHLEGVLSWQEYGNYLPQFWQEVRRWALDPRLREIPLLHRVLEDRSLPVITATVDGLHAEAGSDPVVEAFGNLQEARCLRCQQEAFLTLEQLEALEEGVVPSCPRCGKARLRPDLVLRGEHLKHRRVCDDFVSEAEEVYFVGVEQGDSTILRWASLAPTSILVSPQRTEGFSYHLELSPQEWAEAGCPLLQKV